VALLVPLSLLPPESVGQSSLEPELELDEELESVVESVVEVLVVVDELSDAYAATPIPAVPASAAAIKAPVSNDVRRSPVSRFISALPLR
jgi:hypothetical protein